MLQIFIFAIVTEFEEIADEEGGHRGKDDPPARTEHPFIGFLPRPTRCDREVNDRPFHECHEGERCKTGPDRPARPGVAVDLRHHVIDEVRDREKQDSRTERPRTDARKIEKGAFLGPDYVREKDVDDERD